MKFSGIKTTLFLSFSIFVGLTLVAVLTSWVSFTALQQNQSKAVNLHIPAMVEINRLVDLGGQLTLQTSRMISALSIAELNTVYASLEATLGQLQSSTLLNRGAESDAYNQSLLELLAKLSGNAQLIFANTDQSLAINRKIFEKSIQLEWARNDALDEISPLLEDMTFNLDLMLKPNDVQSEAIRRQIDELVVLADIRGQINLITNIVIRAGDGNDLQDLENNRIYAYQLLAALRQETTRLSDSPSMLSSIQIIGDFINLISAENNLFLLGMQRLELDQDNLALIHSNQQLLGDFNRQIKVHMLARQNSVFEDAHLAEQRIGQSQFLLLIILVACLVIAMLTGWLYVDRSLVHRILRLHHNMQAIAAGRMNTDIVTTGRDEICSMARSLESFRDTLVSTQQELVQAGKLAALGQLSAGVAHELNQPLAAIRNFSHNSRVLLDRKDFERAADNLASIEQLVEKMASIITQFKDFSRKPSPDIQPVMISEILDSALGLLENRMRISAIDLKIGRYDRSLRVQAETIRLEQVLINLFSNAIDALQTVDQRRLFVDLETLPDQARLRIRIRDSGPGITPEVAEQVFEPFFTTKQPGEGLGLGLSISYNIIRDFDGKLYLNPVSGGGAEFVIELDLALG